MSVSRASQYSDRRSGGGDDASARVNAASAVSVTGTPALRSRCPRAATKAALSTPPSTNGFASAELVGVQRLDHEVAVIGSLGESTEARDDVSADQLGGTEHCEGCDPVDRLGKTRGLVDVECADVPDERGGGLDQGCVRGRDAPTEDLHDAFGRRELQPVVEAAPSERIVQVTASVRREDDDRRLLRGERAQLGDGHRRLTEELQEQSFELVVGTVDLVDQQHRRFRTVVPNTTQDRALLKELLTEQVGLAQLLVLRLSQPDREQLTLVVPVVEGLVRRQPLVALQPDQGQPQRFRENLGRLRLSDSGLTLEQQREAELHRQVDRGRRTFVREVVVVGEATSYVFSARQSGAHRRTSSPSCPSSAW